MSAKTGRSGTLEDRLQAFRVSPEGDELIETRAGQIIGLTKQGIHIVSACRKIVVVGNPRVYKALKMELAKVLEELQRIKR